MEFRERWLDDEDETMPAVVLQEGEIIKTEGATLRVEYGATTTPTSLVAQKSVLPSRFGVGCGQARGTGRTTRSST